MPKNSNQRLSAKIYEFFYAVIRKLWVTAFFYSTIVVDFRHRHLFNHAPAIQQVRFFLPKFKGWSGGLTHCRSPPSDFDFASQLKIEIGGLPMKKINLRDYYPFYTKDTVVEVPEEIALLLREYELLEEAYRIRTYRLI